MTRNVHLRICVPANARLPGIDGRDDAESVLQRRRSIEAQVLAVTRADHLHRLRETVPDAHGQRHGGQSERVDGDGHAHPVDGLGHTTVVQVGARLEGDVGEDRRDDQRVRLLEFAPRPQQRVPNHEAHPARMPGVLSMTSSVFAATSIDGGSTSSTA